MTYFISNLSFNLQVKELFLNQRTFGEITRNMVDRAMCPIRQFWKSVNIWGNDGKSLVYCFSTHGVLATISQSVMLVWFVSTRQNRRVPLRCTVARCDIVPGRSGRVVSASDCGVRGPRFESHRGRLCLSRQPLRYTALGTGCAP